MQPSYENLKTVVMYSLDNHYDTSKIADNLFNKMITSNYFMKINRKSYYLSRLIVKNTILTVDKICFLFIFNIIANKKGIKVFNIKRDESTVKITVKYRIE